MRMEENGELLRRYDTLLELYAELESVSGKICRTLETGSSIQKVAEILNEKKMLVEHIEQESRAIASMKKNITNGHFLSDEERARVKVAEEKLTDLVTRVIEQGKKTYDLMMKQGVNVTRK